MKISIITLFPNLFIPFLSTSLIDRSSAKKLVEYELVDLRRFGIEAHKTVDGRPYGGGAGMILRADVLTSAWKSVAKPTQQHKQYTILMTPSGNKWSQSKAKKLSSIGHLIIVCGRYEGVDQRFIDNYVDEEISIGDYVLMGGEIAAMVIIETVVRLIPAVIRKEEAIINESFTKNLLEHPHYTRPDIFEGKTVPRVLKSGDHQKIEEWRHKESLTKTKLTRPELLQKI